MLSLSCNASASMILLSSPCSVRLLFSSKSNVRFVSLLILTIDNRIMMHAILIYSVTKYEWVCTKWYSPKWQFPVLGGRYFDVKLCRHVFWYSQYAPQLDVIKNNEDNSWLVSVSNDRALFGLTCLLPFYTRHLIVGGPDYQKLNGYY